MANWRWIRGKEREEAARKCKITSAIWEAIEASGLNEEATPVKVWEYINLAKDGVRKYGPTDHIVVSIPLKTHSENAPWCITFADAMATIKLEKINRRWAPNMDTFAISTKPTRLW